MGSSGGQPRFVTVVVPARNEEASIGACLESVCIALRRYGPGEVVVVDGQSTDSTRAVVSNVAAGAPVPVRIAYNERRITPAAFNIGIREARGPLVAIVSGHSTVHADFFLAAAAPLERGEADIVGGPIETQPGRAGVVAWLLARLVSHPFGVGNSKFRTSSVAQLVDAIPFGVFERRVFDTVGLFDEELVRNQDTEFFGRVRRAGFRVLLDPAVRSTYRARGTLAGLLRQGYLNGYWLPPVWRRSPGAFRWRHAVPALFVIGLLAGGALGTVSRAIAVVWLSAISVHALIGLAAAVQVSWRSRRPAALALALLFMPYHVAYGLGTLAGALRERQAVAK